MLFQLPIPWMTSLYLQFRHLWDSYLFINCLFDISPERHIKLNIYKMEISPKSIHFYLYQHHKVTFVFHMIVVTSNLVFSYHFGPSSNSHSLVVRVIFGSKCKSNHVSLKTFCWFSVGQRLKTKFNMSSVQFSSVQLLSRVRLFAIPCPKRL